MPLGAVPTTDSHHVQPWAVIAIADLSHSIFICSFCILIPMNNSYFYKIMYNVDASVLQYCQQSDKVNISKCTLSSGNWGPRKLLLVGVCNFADLRPKNCQILAPFCGLRAWNGLIYPLSCGFESIEWYFQGKEFNLVLVHVQASSYSAIYVDECTRHCWISTALGRARVRHVSEGMPV